ncbi:MAG: GNAT family N-acetyltransferase [Ruminococcus sp.]|nr:GNAT family N-acetyltransferase [Ruminococcus sp.]
MYKIYKVRTEVFVVEQQCCYQEVDKDDLRAYHIFFSENGEIKAYLRMFEHDETTARIGRVLVTDRGKGLGKAIVTEGIKAAKEKLGKKNVFIEAQTYIIPMYEKLGFRVISDEFLDVGIPHKEMILESD